LITVCKSFPWFFFGIIIFSTAYNQSSIKVKITKQAKITKPNEIEFEIIKSHINTRSKIPFLKQARPPIFFLVLILY